MKSRVAKIGPTCSPPSDNLATAELSGSDIVYCGASGRLETLACPSGSSCFESQLISLQGDSRLCYRV